ncbi:MAG: pirin family protein [Candidatus Paceibacterota bacterium]
MQKIVHRAADRGSSDHGWLQSKFSFSFADWYEPRRMGYGTLRVINDDTIAPRGKFDMHSHEDFEITTIPLAGAVTHQDSMGNKGVVSAGEVQTMSAGTGVTHSEENASPTDTLRLFQIWIEPREKGMVPRYAQRAFAPSARRDRWQLLVSADGSGGSLPIYQDARIARADIGLSDTLTYSKFYKHNGVYLLVIEGEVEVVGESLHRRDAIGVAGLDTVEVTALTDAQMLLFEVPL